MPNGDLVAAGSTPSTGTTHYIARWNGTSWATLGSTNAMICALAVLPNGDLVAGGTFTTAGGNAASRIARWNGSTWAQLDTGLNEIVSALVVLPNGDLIAGGRFTWAGLTPLAFVARWDGSAWSAVGSTQWLIGWVNALTTLPNGDLVAGGSFTLAGGVAANNIARWDGTGWSPLGSGVSVAFPSSSSTEVLTLATLPNGDLVAAGNFQVAGGVAADRIAHWNGTVWTPFGSGFTTYYSIYPDNVYTKVAALAALSNGDFVVGGVFTTTDGVGVSNIARWNVTAWWSALGPGMNGRVLALTTLPGGDVVAGGYFTTAGGIAANRIARGNGITWSPLGTGMNGAVAVLKRLPNGDLVAGGLFTTAGGVTANHIARWNGTAWSPLGSGVSGYVYDLATLPNGDLVAGGDFLSAGGVAANRIARWNGTAWSPIGLGFNRGVNALTTLPNGDIVAGGSFTQSGLTGLGRIARWNGTAWQDLGGMGPEPAFGGWDVEALLTLPNGDLVAGGYFGMAGGVIAHAIARWNGTAWSPIGTGYNLSAAVLALTTLPNGDLVAGGYFTNLGRVARWNGNAWSPFGSGVGSMNPTSYVAAFATTPNGDLIVGGNFASVGGLGSAYVARLTTTCPATAVALGTGCPSSGGANALTTNLPWTGSTWNATATGLPSPAFVLAVNGLTTTSLPLASLLPQGVPGCMLRVTPDYLGVQFSTTGTASFAFTLPNTSALAGAVFHHQMVPIEVDASLAFVAATSTNAVTLTIGAF